MDGFELNKIFGALTGAFMVFLAITIVTEGMFGTGGGHHGHEEKLAFSIAVEEEDGGGEKEEVAEVPIEELLASADVEKGAKVFKKCGACHTAESGGAHKVGPALHGVVGRDVASTDYPKYSGSLPAGTWDFAALNGFLKNPKGYAAGTSMAFKGLKKPEDRANVIAWLNQQSDSPLPLPAQ